MSGGYFDYEYFRISQFAKNLQNEINRADFYSKSTLELLLQSQKIIETAGKIAREVEWLYSGDIGEEVFQDEFYNIIKE